MALGGAFAPRAAPRSQLVGRLATGRDRDRAWAIGAALLVVAFMAITCWWVSRDRGVPFGDAASDLFTTVSYRDLIERGELSELWRRSGYYPPTTYLVGALATFAGGLNAAAPVLAQNVVYVPLLGLGVYHAGRLVAGRQAGFLAVLFALGSPLLIEQFHVFMKDAPQTALVALAIWLVLASDRFERLPASIAAGVACGVGVASKEQFPLFVIGLVAVVLARGGWRNWRGLGGFALALAVVGAPWYLVNFSELGDYASAGLANANLPGRGRPPLLSLANLSWYLWALVNAVLFVPLFAFAAVGVVRAVAGIAQRLRDAADRARGDVRLELLAGLLVAWVAITLTPHHDMRYAMPLVPYLAVLGTGWIVGLPRPGRRVATGALALAAAATTLGISFGVGPDMRLGLGTRAANTTYGIPSANEVTFHADHNFAVSAPRRGDDVLGLLKAMRRDGVTGIAWSFGDGPIADRYFDSQGVAVFVRFADLTMFDLLTGVVVRAGPGRQFPRAGSERWFRAVWNVDDPAHVYLMRRAAYADEPPCMRLRDGTGLWLRRGSGDVPGAPPYCPPGFGDGG